MKYDKPVWNRHVAAEQRAKAQEEIDRRKTDVVFGLIHLAMGLAFVIYLIRSI